MSITKRVAVYAFTTLLTFLIGVSVAKFRPAFRQQHIEPSPWQVLLSFENQDLGNLNDQSSQILQKAIDAITGGPNPAAFAYFEPQLFRTILNTKSEQRYILVEEAPLLMIPGGSRLRVHVFDTLGNVLSGEDFGAGWRTILTSMRVRKIPFLDQEALVVDGEYCFGGHPSHQYYVVAGNRIVLAYFEKDGEFDLNDFQNWNLTIGPAIRGRSADDWERALRSDDTAEITSALMWLGGTHWNGQAAPYDSDKSEAEKVSILRSRNEVRKTLRDLAHSTNPWIQTAAQATLESDPKW